MWIWYPDGAVRAERYGEDDSINQLLESELSDEELEADIRTDGAS